jgi:hypothetical protein
MLLEAPDPNQLDLDGANSVDASRPHQDGVQAVPQRAPRVQGRVEGSPNLRYRAIHASTGAHEKNSARSRFLCIVPSPPRRATAMKHLHFNESRSGRSRPAPAAAQEPYMAPLTREMRWSGQPRSAPTPLENEGPPQKPTWIPPHAVWPPTTLAFLAPALYPSWPAVGDCFVESSDAGLLCTYSQHVSEFLATLCWSSPRRIWCLSSCRRSKSSSQAKGSDFRGARGS